VKLPEKKKKEECFLFHKNQMVGEKKTAGRLLPTKPGYRNWRKSCYEEFFVPETWEVTKLPLGKNLGREME